MHVLIKLFIAAVVALPLGGFVFGFVICKGCGWNLFGRAFIGVVFAVLTPLFGGFPPRNEGGVGEPFNVWPYILGTGLVVFLALLPIRLGSRRPPAEVSRD